MNDPNTIDDASPQLPPIPTNLPPVPPIPESDYAPPRPSNPQSAVQLLVLLVFILVIGLIGFAVWSFSAVKDQKQQTTSAISQTDTLSAAKEDAELRAANAEVAALAARKEAERAAELEKQASQKLAAMQQQADSLATSQEAPSETSQRFAAMPQQLATQSVQMNGLEEFFQSYINSLATNDPWAVANHYADTAHYCYAKPPSYRASRADIADDARKFISSYPQRNYSNIIVKQTSPLGPNAARINYTFDYQYNGKKLAMGSTDVWITVENNGYEWRVTSFDETVRRRR